MKEEVINKLIKSIRNSKRVDENGKAIDIVKTNADKVNTLIEEMKGAFKKNTTSYLVANMRSNWSGPNDYTFCGTMRDALYCILDNVSDIELSKGKKTMQCNCSSTNNCYEHNAQIIGLTWTQGADILDWQDSGNANKIYDFICELF